MTALLSDTIWLTKCEAKKWKNCKKKKKINCPARPHGYINRLANVQTFRQKSSHAFARVKCYLQHTLLVERDEISVHTATIDSTDINFTWRKMSRSITSDNRGDFSIYEYTRAYEPNLDIESRVLHRGRLLFVRSLKLVKKKIFRYISHFNGATCGEYEKRGAVSNICVFNMCSNTRR